MNFIKLTNEKLNIDSISVLIGDNCPISLFVITKGADSENTKVSVIQKATKLCLYSLNKIFVFQYFLEIISEIRPI